MMKQAAPGAKLLLVGTQKDWNPVRPARAHAGYKTHSNKNNPHVKLASLSRWVTMRLDLSGPLSRKISGFSMQAL
jgi:hypothetical protein